MYSPFEPLFWAYALYFLLAATLAFFIPGNLLLRKLKLDIFSEIILSIIVGFVIWSLQGFIFGYLQLRWLTYIYLLTNVGTWATFYARKFFNQVRFKQHDLLLSVILIIGTLIQLSSIWPNGIVVNEGLYFCCGMPDTLYHLALTSELVTQFPPHEPGISGVVLQNYHYLSNLGVADLIRIFHLPLISTQYQYMTVLMSILLGLSVLVLANLLNFARTVKIWLLLLLFFCGDIIFLLSYLNGKGINFLYTTLENAQSLWISPPRFYAVVVFFAGLSLFALWLKKKDLFTGIIMAIVFASLISIKIYVGAIMLAGLGVLAIIYLFKKEYRMLLPLLVFYLVSSAIFLPINSKSGGLFYSGFWRFEDFAAQPSLGLIPLALAQQIFAEHHNSLRVLLYDLYFGFLYTIFSAGVLMLGLFQTKNSLKNLPQYFTLTLTVGLLATCAAGFFFLQKTGGSNSGQFLISIYVIGIIYAAVAIAWWLGKLPPKFAVILGVVLLSLISTRVIHDATIRINTLKDSTGPSVTGSTLNSLKYFTKTKTSDTVLTFDEANFNCLLIKIIGKSSAFTCTLGAPADRGVDLTNKIAIRQIIFQGKNLEKSKTLLKANKISYIYMPKTEVKASNIGKMNLQKVYENETVIILTQNK